MFSKFDRNSCVALSAELSDEPDWNAGVIRILQYHQDFSVLAFDPVSGLLAIGTKTGVIHIFGSPGVEYRLSLSEPISVQQLCFAAPLAQLLCVDERNRLHVWDIGTGRPRLQTITRFNSPINCITVSPSHTHAFVALSTGVVKTFDLLCLRNSPYVVPNVWTRYEEKMLASGLPAAPSPGSAVPVDVVIHPRDLNILMIAYGGGIALYDLTQSRTLRTFELILPPGAPGGAGYTTPDLLSHRRPSVTSLAVHPAGHFFAVGYIDGSIAFWALEDEDKPLLVKTFDDDDINIVDANVLNEVLSSQVGNENENDIREPIFKLSWSGFPNSSDPRGGETVLTALGGLRSSEPSAVTTLLFPAFNPSVSPSSPNAGGGLDALIRAAIRESLTPLNAYRYHISGTAQDYLLFPRASPHFCGTWDPEAILLLSDFVADSRGVEAYQFPPPVFGIDTSKAKYLINADQHIMEDMDEDDAAAVLAKELASTVQAMSLSDDPTKLSILPALWSGSGGVVNGELVKLERDSYERLTDLRGIVDANLPLRGGSAWVDDLEGEMKLMKFQPRRILITHHEDLTIRFQDLSADLLVSSSSDPLHDSFPKPLPALTIDLMRHLADPSLLTRTFPRFLEDARIDVVCFATESLECAIALKSGEVILYRLDENNQKDDTVKELQDNELASLAHVDVTVGERYSPSFMVITKRGPLSACGMSDVGFLAVAYMDGSLFVVDMRGPRVILRKSTDVANHRHSFLHRQGEPDPITSLTWTVCGIDADITPHVRLIATHLSGTASLFTLSRSTSGVWAVDDEPMTLEAVPHPIPNTSFVLDAQTGKRHKADRGGLAAAMSAVSDIHTASNVTKKIQGCFLISAGTKGARCVANVTGEKVSRVDWGSKAGTVEHAEVVSKNGASVLVAFTDRRVALIYSLPFLEILHTLQLPQTSSEPLTVDETGDYIEFSRHPSGLIETAGLGTLFNIRRSGPYTLPQVNLATNRGVIPPQPQPVSAGPTSLLSSWIGYISSQGMTGDQVDALLAGPDRPIPQPPEPKKPTPATTRAGEGSTAASQVHAMSVAASSGVSDLYNRLGTAIAERGQMLGDLQESFTSLEQGSKSMMNQAKSMAAQQTAKKWLPF